MAGEEDSAHLAYAIGADRVLLSHNHRDFRNLHNLVMQAKGRHSEILIVRKDNSPTRDLKPAGVMRAIRNLEQAGVPLKSVRDLQRRPIFRQIRVRENRFLTHLFSLFQIPDPFSGHASAKRR